MLKVTPVVLLLTCAIDGFLIITTEIDDESKFKLTVNLNLIVCSLFLIYLIYLTIALLKYLFQYFN